MSFEKLRRDFTDPEYAHSYADGFLNSYIATQIKVLREKHGLTQQRLAQETGMRQARISVLENVNYSAWSINTLRRLARAFQLRLKVSFEEFGTLLPELESFSRESLERRPLEEDPVFQGTRGIVASMSETVASQAHQSSLPLGSVFALNLRGHDLSKTKGQAKSGAVSALAS